MASVKVAVRVRPMNRREKDLEAKFIIEMEGKKTTITNMKLPDGVTGDSGRERTKTFTYDFSYFSADSKNANYVSQEWVFKDLGSEVLKSAFEGYNACVFAYGQTGSGKSYTMMGNPGDSGLIPRICEGLFSRIAEITRRGDASFRTEVSYLEIYNERVRDLLRRKSSKTFNLRVREHPKEGPYVEDLSKHLVQNYSDVEELMDAGNINRTTAATGMNDVSSRSHAIFTINFTQAKFDAEMPCETVSKIHLVDLAGSERADATGATGVRLKEGGNINKSLVTLGNVISALADLSQDATNHLAKKKQVFVPYRDSVLTWLLKDSLGGNAKTIMIATISPADINYGETLSTLRYANRAKNIINKPTINEDANVKLIRELRAEIARLKALLAQGNQIALLDSPTALSMEEKLQQNEARVEELTKEWTNKWNETQNILKEQTLALRKEGIGVVLDSELPHLIGIDDDLLSTGIILYHLKEGRTYVGREDAASEQDIVLHGLDLESEHCIFENLNGTVTLIPLNEAQCSVNGIQIVEPSQLNQGAVILLGRTNMFRFNHPKEAAKLREKRKSGLLSAFSLSMTDLSKSCENLSAVMLYNPGLEFERQQREELEKLEHKRLSHEIQQLKQKIHVTADPLSKNQLGAQEEKPPLATSPASPVKTQTHFPQLTDDRIHAYIEEEVQRRLQNINLPSEDLSSLNLSYSSETGKGNYNFLNSITQRKMKYEKILEPQANPEKVSFAEIGSDLLLPTRQTGVAVIERQNQNPVTANLYSCFTRKYSDSQEKHLKEENEKRKNRSSISEYFDFLSDTEREPSHLLSRELCNSKCSHQNISFAAQKFPAKTKGKHLESVSGDRNFFQMESDRTFFQQMSSSEMKTLDNEQPECNDIFHCNLSETNMLPENEGKKLCYPTHQGILQQPCAYQRDSDNSLCQNVAHQKYNLQSLFSKFSHLYKETNLPTIQNVIKQAKELYSIQADSTRNIPGLSFIKDLSFGKYFPFIESSQVNTGFAISDPRDNKVKLYSTGQPNVDNEKAEQLVLFELSLRKASENWYGQESKTVTGESASSVSLAFLNFPNKFFSLIDYSVDELLDYLICTLPDFQADKNQFKGLYWHSLGAKNHRKCQPACLLMFTSDLFFILFLGHAPKLFCSIPLTSFQELHICFGGQSVHLLGTFEYSPLAVFTFDSHCTLQLCRDLTKMLMPELSYTKFISHPLLSIDLMELSIDWNANVSDIVCSNGFKLTCNFKNALADIVYLLHENTNGPKPPLGDLRLLLYTAVKVETSNAQSVHAWLALTNTSVALVHDEALLPDLWVSGSSSSTFNQLNLHPLNNVRCIILKDRDNLNKMALVFSKSDSELHVPLEEDDLVSAISEMHGLSSMTDVWSLTFSSCKHALFFIRHLT
ncbi:kinesin-like protein KIF16B isoform X2 [Pyxicephalus adspersus]|uniref:kinesin-like protein KIF16B isoform X2 n=1 Tax=Pyxicephalus adspersus TaxID=30357 RepID=UPI003B5CB7F6